MFATKIREKTNRRNSNRDDASVKSVSGNTAVLFVENLHLGKSIDDNSIRISVTRILYGICVFIDSQSVR